MCQQNDIIFIFFLSHVIIRLIINMDEKKNFEIKNKFDLIKMKKISNFKG